MMDDIKTTGNAALDAKMATMSEAQQANAIRFALLGGGNKMLGVRMHAIPRHPHGHFVQGLYPKLGVVQMQSHMGGKIPPLLVMEYNEKKLPLCHYKIYSNTHSTGLR